MFGINGWEAVILVVIALLVIGPERLPEYVAKLRQWIREMKKLADGARTQLRDQMGPEFDNVDWSAYDIRQYDPRRIVREAISDVWNEDTGTNEAAGDGASQDTVGSGPSDSSNSSDSSNAAASADAAGSRPSAHGSTAAPPPRMGPGVAAAHDPSRPVPFDAEAT